MDNNTINLSDDSGSDETYCPPYEDKKHLRASQPPHFHTRGRKYDQESHSQTQAHNDQQSHTHSQTQTQNEQQSPSQTQTQNYQQSNSQTQHEAQRTPSKDKDKDEDKDMHPDSPTVHRSQRARNREAKKRAFERGIFFE